MKAFRIKPESHAFKLGVKVALIYLAVGFTWILFSDLVVDFVFGPTRLALWVQTFKGWFFVIASAALVYSLIGRAMVSLHESEDALGESRRVLSALFENLPGMAYRCKMEPDLPFVFVSAGALELTGASPYEMVGGQSLKGMVHAMDREKVLREIKDALEQRRPFRLVHRIRDKGDRIKWAWNQGMGTYSESGTLIGIEGYIQDISERKRAEEALQKSEEIYRTLADGTSDAILMVDQDRNIVSVNRAFLDLFGYTREELEGQSVRLVHPSDESHADFAKAAYPAMVEAPLRIEWELRKKDGTIFPIEGTYSVLREPDGSLGGHVGIIRDITERKKAERELKAHRENLRELVAERTRELEEAQKALVQREKLKTLGTIAAEVAHEIRNPLVSIGGFARRLQKKYPGSKEAEIILHESWRLETMLNRLSEYLRPVELRPRSAHINAILSETLDLLSSDFQTKKVNLRLELDPELPAAYVDPAVLTQVFIVMIRNALQMMSAEREFTVRSYSGENNVYVELISSAPKMKATDPEYLLLPFDACGQGISNTFKLLKGMGGVLAVAYAEGKVTFTVSLVKAHESEPGKMEQEWPVAG